MSAPQKHRQLAAFLRQAKLNQQRARAMVGVKLKAPYALIEGALLWAWHWVAPAQLKSADADLEGLWVANAKPLRLSVGAELQLLSAWAEVLHGEVPADLADQFNGIVKRHNSWNDDFRRGEAAFYVHLVDPATRLAGELSANYNKRASRTASLVVKAL
jgi:hypothetical protein